MLYIIILAMSSFFYKFCIAQVTVMIPQKEACRLLKKTERNVTCV